MRRILTVILLLTSAMMMSAEEINALMLHLASGKTVTCLLDERPVVTFAGDELVVTTHMSTMSYASADVLKFTYTYVDPDAIESTKAQGTLFALSGSTMSATNLTPQSEVSVYSTDGKLLSSSKTDSRGNVTLTLPAGKVYVVKTSIANFKICKP